MKLFITLFLTLIYCSINAQIRTINILSSEGRIPLSNVLVYSNNNLIAETNKLGQATLELTKGTVVTLVKEDFKDLSIAVEDLKDIVFLEKNSPILLKEVIIKPLSDEDILNNVERYLKNLIEEKYLSLKPATFTQYYNLFKSDNDTLQYLNNRFRYIKGRGILMDNKNKILKNFKFLSKNSRIDSCVYSIGNKTVEFSDVLTLPYQNINNEEQLTNIFKNKKNYLFKVSRDEKYYRIDFTPKSKKSFSYAGFLTVDVNDYGFYEFSSKLIESSSNVKTVQTKSLPKIRQLFVVKNEVFYIRYVKINDDYIFDYSVHDIAYFQKEGNFKNRLFVNSWRIETTPSFESNNLVKLDFLKWEIK